MCSLKEVERKGCVPKRKYTGNGCVQERKWTGKDVFMKGSI